MSLAPDITEKIVMSSMSLHQYWDMSFGEYPQLSGVVVDLCQNNPVVGVALSLSV